MGTWMKEVDQLLEDAALVDKPASVTLRWPDENASHQFVGPCGG
jgi:hypothetical protein